MKSNTFLRVQRRFGEVFSLPPEQVSASTSPDSLAAWDSLQHLNLVLVLEQEFRIQFTPEEMRVLFSVEADRTPG